MAQRFLRNRKTGTVFHWCEILEERTDMEEITEEIAFPRKAMPEAYKDRVSKVDLAAVTADQPKLEKHTPPELAADAARGLKVPTK